MQNASVTSTDRLHFSVTETTVLVFVSRVSVVTNVTNVPEDTSATLPIAGSAGNASRTGMIF